MRWIAVAGLLTLFVACAGRMAPPSDDKLRAATAGGHRSEANRARDRHRHPLETLTFFGLHDEMTVIELWPGSGWYTDILAPVLKDRGHLIVVDPMGSDYPEPKRPEPFSAAVAVKNDAIFGRVQVVTIELPKHVVFGPPNSADLVLAIRYLHGWIGIGIEKSILAECHRVLKPGGILGVIAHRGRRGSDPKATGYIEEDEAIRIVEAAGFELVARSEINSNPKDTKDHPEGVWTLPPTLRLGDTDREKYLAIGESDRMTLKFVKR